MTRRAWTVLTVIALLGSLAGWGWFATEQARAGWWALGQHSPIEPDDQGWATLDPTLGVRLVEAQQVPEVEEEQPPAGFAYLQVDLEVRAEPAAQGDEPDALGARTTCAVQVRDHQGRLFLAGEEVPRAEHLESSLRCGTADPEDPVPGHQSLLVLLPADAEPVSVRVAARDFPPATFLELPVAP